jgi:hypothetical protein
MEAVRSMEGLGVGFWSMTFNGAVVHRSTGVALLVALGSLFGVRREAGVRCRVMRVAPMKRGEDVARNAGETQTNPSQNGLASEHQVCDAGDCDQRPQDKPCATR